MKIHVGQKTKQKYPTQSVSITGGWRWLKFCDINHFYKAMHQHITGFYLALFAIVGIVVGAVVLTNATILYSLKAKGTPKPTQPTASSPIAQIPAASTNPGTGTAQIPPAVTGRYVGIMGAMPEDFAVIKSWGANTVEYHGVKSAANLASVFASAKTEGLKLFIKGPGKEEIQGQGFGLDLDQVASVTRNYFTGNTVAGDPDFIGFWIVDEPCHANKWDLSGQDLKNLYSTIKQVNSGIPVLINFGTLECFQQIIATAQPGWKLVDVAMFTVTVKKTGSRRGNYITDQAAIARTIKAFDPAIIVLPNLAVLEFIDHNAPIPDTEWVKSNGLATLGQSSFDGVMYYSFRSLSPWMGQTIINVKDDPAYQSAFKTVFAAK